MYWKNSETTGNTYYWRENGWKQKTGTTMASYIQYKTTSSDSSIETNTELEVTSTDEKCNIR